MRLTVEQSGKIISDLRFEQGPIYIGRQLGSQVFLPEVTVSRQHAVIYSTQGGAWALEDLDSANKKLMEVAVRASELGEEIGRNPLPHHRIKIGKRIQTHKSAGSRVLLQRTGPDVGADVGGGLPGDGGKQHLFGGLTHRNRLHQDVDIGMKPVPAANECIGQGEFLRVGGGPVGEFNAGRRVRSSLMPIVASGEQDSPGDHAEQAQAQ